MKARDRVLQEESRCIKQEQSICPLVIIEHTGAAAKLFNACQSKPQRVSGLIRHFGLVWLEGIANFLTVLLSNFKMLKYMEDKNKLKYIYKLCELLK